MKQDARTSPRPGGEMNWDEYLPLEPEEQPDYDDGTVNADDPKHPLESDG